MSSYRRQKKTVTLARSTTEMLPFAYRGLADQIRESIVREQAAAAAEQARKSSESGEAS